MSFQQNGVFGVLFSVFIALFFSIALTDRASASECSCVAPDGSCSTSISCAGSCSAICTTGGNCWAKCGNGPYHQEPLIFVPTSDDRGLTAAVGLDAFLSFHVDAAGAQEVSQELSRCFGAPVMFIPGPSFESLSMQVDGFPGRELLEILSQGGNMILASNAADTGRVAGEEALRQVLFLQADETSPTAVLEQLEAVLGVTLHFEPRNEEGVVTLQVKGATVLEVLQMLARLGTLEVNGQAIAAVR